MENYGMQILQDIEICERDLERNAEERIYLERHLEELYYMLKCNTLDNSLNIRERMEYKDVE